MARINLSPGIVPYGADQTVYMVVDSFGTDGIAYRETDIEQADLETVISDFMAGQFNAPVRVVAFNTLEHWSEDVSEDIAAEIQSRCDMDGIGVPEHIRDFVRRHGQPHHGTASRLPAKGAEALARGGTVLKKRPSERIV